MTARVDARSDRPVPSIMTGATARRLYSLGWYVALPWVAAYLLLRSLRQPHYRSNWRERFFGAGPRPAAGATAASAGTSVIWLHAVSVGETRAAQPLIELLAVRNPRAQFVLTHMTPTGREAAQPLLQALAGRITQRYLPYDLPAAVRRFLGEVRPSILVLLETEIWPNLQFEAQRAAVPVILVNARLSERSLARALRWPALMRPAAAALSAVAAQSTADQARWAKLYPGPTHVTGNLKFDAAPPAEQLQAGRAWRGRLGPGVWMFASTREGEERAIVEALMAAAREGKPYPTLLFVPRHPQRFDEVARLLAGLGHPVVRRAQFASMPADSRVLLGDSMGEMPMYYAMADVALIGGSLVPLGGQNLIEACACGCPVLFGPHMFNFSQAAADALAWGAARQVSDAAEAVQAMFELQADPGRREKMAQAATAFAQAHRGATERTVELIDGVLAGALARTVERSR
jgi:3-deoxy-D-manno-octulosonic-acid transferase